MTTVAELRSAQAALEPARVLDALDRTLESWRAPHSLWRARLRREHRFFSPEVIEAGTREALEGWTREALAGLRAREVADGAVAPRVTAVWLAGTIPSSAFAAMLLPLLAGSASYVRPSSGDRTSPRLFADSLRAADPELGAAIALGGDERALSEADAVVAYGSDETLAQLRARVPVHAIFVAHGHKFSAIALGLEAALEAAAREVAFEVALYDGRGCLSPAYVFVEDDPPGRAGAFAEALASELERASHELPRGVLSAEEQSRLQHLRAGLAARGDAKLWMSRGSLGWTVVLSEFGAGPPVPGALRLVPVVPVRDLEALGEWLASFAPYLSTLAHAGFGERASALAPLVRAAGGSRLCAPGRMQFPAIGWHHDGVPPLAALLRYVDAEPDPPESE